MTNRAAVDLGSTRIGLAAADVSVMPLRLLAPPHVVDVGEFVELAEPVEYTRKDGTPSTRTHEYRRTRDDEAKAATAVIAWLYASGATEVVIESEDNIFGKGAAELISKSKAKTVAERIGGRIAGGAEQLGMRVTISGAGAWRGRLRRYSRGMGTVLPAITAESGAALDTLFAVHYAAWPGVAGLGKGAADARDAAGLLLSSALLIADARTRKRGPRKPGEPRPKLIGAEKIERHRVAARVSAKRQAKRLADVRREERAAIGCACGFGGRHRRDCPMFKPKPGAAPPKPPRACGCPRGGHARSCSENAVNKAVALFHARAAEQAASRAKR